MTAVASPIAFQPPSRTGWNTSSGGQSALGSSDEVSRMFMSGPRKTAQRTNSASSLNSSASTNSTLSAASAQTNGGQAADGWGTRKKPNRGIWPTGKSEPTAGISTARPQMVSSGSSGPSAASAISALHAPMLPSQQNLQAHQNGTLRNGDRQGVEQPAFLYLLPINNTFERKTIKVPFFPDVLRIGRQTNAKTAPTPINGFFDSKVLSRQHAEIYSERSGRIFIRDVKSSNGTFVNGKRLSPENKESEPHELREQDVLELGIDIVSEDQKTVVHHKVAARVEHAGIYTPTNDINFGDLDPSGSGGFVAAQQMKRTASQGSMQSMKGNAAAAMAREANGMQQQGWSRVWLQPISTEQIVKRLNRELTLAKQQSQDLARAKQYIEGFAAGENTLDEKDEKSGSGKHIRPSPSKLKTDARTQFPEPPAPPPQQPLPEKPDVAKALNDPFIQPLLQRSDTARPFTLGNGSPTKGDHSQALLILTHELKMAKDQIPNLVDRVKNLEEQLRAERIARESAEERANQLETGSRKDSANDNQTESVKMDDIPANGALDDGANAPRNPPDLSLQLERLKASMDDMKQQMEAYRRRAETAESEHDKTRKTLAEMIEQKRKDNAESDEWSLSRSRTLKTSNQNGHALAMNGHMAAPTTIAFTDLLERAGVDTSKPLTQQQAATIQRLLGQEALKADVDDGGVSVQWNRLSYHGVPHACALTTVMLGLALMHYLNGWEKVTSVHDVLPAPVVFLLLAPLRLLWWILRTIALDPIACVWDKAMLVVLRVAELAWAQKISEL